METKDLEAPGYAILSGFLLFCLFSGAGAKEAMQPTATGKALPLSPPLSQDGEQDPREIPKPPTARESRPNDGGDCPIQRQ